MKDSFTAVWKDVLNIIEAEISTPVSFKTWFLPIRPEQLTDQELTLSVPTQTAMDILRQKYAELIKNSVAHVLRREVAINIVVADLPESYAPPIEKERKKKKEEPKRPESTCTTAGDPSFFKSQVYL